MTVAFNHAEEWPPVEEQSPPDRATVLANIRKAVSGDAKRRIANRAFDAGIITRIDLMQAIQAAKSAPDRLTDSGEVWTAADDVLLHRLVSKGETFSLIAEHFGGRTRDACIGRAHRLGLKHPNGGL